MTKAVKKQILAAQIASKRSELNENSLYLTLSAFFEKLKQKVLKEFDTYYTDDIMLQGQLDLILSPIHISHKTYFNIIKKHIRKEHKLGASEAKRLVKLAQKKHNSSDKAEKLPINSIIKKGELFGTSEYSRQKLFNQSFKASESTMARIDSDINKILSDGYTQGWGQNAIAADITKRFDQLKDWEAKRIARTEIHNAHNMAMMQTYEEMDVEYIQWNAASDARVRDSHKKLSGEITKLGEKFSNNLSYPGDTEGNIKEWINCRCVNSPFLIPPGYIAPSFTPFREKDLIPTLDYWNQDEILSQATQELSSAEYNSLERQLLDIKRSVNEWDINRLTPEEREVYLKAKKNYLILKDARDDHNYSNLDSLEDAGSFYQINSKAKFMEYTDNGTDFEGWLNDELAEYLDDIERYEKIIKDTNIKVTTEPKRIKWNNPQLKDDYYVINPETGEYEFFNMDEKFIRYHFKKENLTILESVDMPTSRVRSLYKQYKKLPARLQNTREIVLSSQKPVKFSFMGEYRGIGGYVVEGKGTRIVQFRKSMTETVDTVVHEATHNLEKDKLFYISNSKEYVLAFKKDQNRLLAQGKELEDTYITRYAHEFTEDALKTNSIYKNRIYSEDLAESMKMYLKNKETFTETYPEKTQVLEKILKGEFKPKTTIPYKKWADIESERFTLTQKELQKYSKLRWKQTDLAKEGKLLTAAERKELKFYEDKTKMDWLYRKKIEGEHLTSSEEKTFKELSQKYKKKLKINQILSEEINDNGFDNKNKFSFTKKDKLKYEELQKLKQQNKLKGFLNNNEFNLLNNQKKLDALHKKFIKKGKLSSKEAVIYKKLYNNVRIQHKFKLEVLEDTFKLEGKLIKNIPQDTEFLGNLDNPKNIKEFKGTTKDGMLPGNESIDKYFTKNVSTTEKYDEFIERWVYYRGYQDIQLFDKCKRNVRKLKQELHKGNPQWSPKKLNEEVANIVNYYKKYEELMDGAETKKNIKFFRKQVNLNISKEDLEKGETIINSARSMSLSKAGRNKYVNNSKKFKWDLEIEIPAGGKCVYIAPKAKNKKRNNMYIEQMETILGSDTNCDIIKVIDNENVHKIILRVKV